METNPTRTTPTETADRIPEGSFALIPVASLAGSPLPKDEEVSTRCKLFQDVRNRRLRYARLAGTRGGRSIVSCLVFGIGPEEAQDLSDKNLQTDFLFADVLPHGKIVWRRYRKKDRARAALVALGFPPDPAKDGFRLVETREESIESAPGATEGHPVAIGKCRFNLFRRHFATAVEVGKASRQDAEPPQEAPPERRPAKRPDAPDTGNSLPEAVSASGRNGKFHGFTLYFQETRADMKWIEVWGSILELGWKSRLVEWRRKLGQEAAKVFLGIHKDGIFIDTIEQPRVAVFIDDAADVEIPRKNGKGRMREVKSWGCGGKTPAQLLRKISDQCKQVLELLDWHVKLGPDAGIKRADVMGLLGFIESQDPKYVETFE